MSSLIRILVRLPNWVAALALFALMVLTFADVMLRSLANAPIEVAADLTRTLMVVVVFAVMPQLSAQGRQISVDLIDSVFVRWNLTRWRDAAVALFCGAMLIWPAGRVYDLAERSRSYGDVMEYLAMPVHYVGWFIAVMTGLTALALLVRGVLTLIAPRLLEGSHA
jgi:TRAP-type C4-dicarboxylate transport system permease small subunit